MKFSAFCKQMAQDQDLGEINSTQLKLKGSWEEEAAPPAAC